MISVVIPVSNLKEYTDECIDTFLSNAVDIDSIEVIVIDNASTVPYEKETVTTIRNEKNIGFWPSVLKGIETAKNDIVVCMHNDVFIHEFGWDKRVKRVFIEDDLLAIAGLFGARGVARNGGRLHPESNMLVEKYGTHGKLHGHLLTDDHPSVVFDSLCMMFRKSLLYTIDYKDIPCHHWTDRLVTLRLLKASYHALTLGIGFDHGGGFTSSTPVMGTFTEDWCKMMGLEMRENWDMTLYYYGAKMFYDEFNEFTGNKGEIWTDSNYNLFFV